MPRCRPAGPQRPGTCPEQEATVRIREHFSPRLMKSLLSSGLRSGSPYLSAEGFLSLLMGNSPLEMGEGISAGL